MDTPDRDPVERAMALVDRAEFLPESQRERASFDGPIRIGFGQTNSQPRTVANMLRLLDVRGGHRVLDVGSGSGWSTAILGELVGPEGRVLGVERVPQLVERSRAVLDARAERAGTERIGSGQAGTGSGQVDAVSAARLEIREARPGVLGLPEDGPFDRILVSAEAQQLPEELVEQLAIGGRMVIPVQKTMLLVVKTDAGIEVSRHGAYVFVPLFEE